MNSRTCSNKSRLPVETLKLLLLLSSFDNHRLVYKWFNFIYKFTYMLGIIGYAVMMATFFGLNMIFGHEPPVWMDPAILVIFYGVYYGVLARDLSEICSERLASNIGVSVIRDRRNVFFCTKNITHNSNNNWNNLKENIFESNLILLCGWTSNIKKIVFVTAS